MTEAESPACVLMRRLIEKTKADIKRTEDSIRRLESLIEKLMSQQPPDTALIQECRETVATLRRELETDRSQLQVLEEEYSAECL